MRNSERCGFRYRSAEFKGLRVFQSAPDRLKSCVLSAFGRGGLEDASSRYNNARQWFPGGITRRSTPCQRSGSESPTHRSFKQNQRGPPNRPAARQGVCPHGSLDNCAKWIFTENAFCAVMEGLSARQARLPRQMRRICAFAGVHLRAFTGVHLRGSWVYT